MRSPKSPTDLAIRNARRARKNKLKRDDRVRIYMHMQAVLDATTPSPKDDPMTDITKAQETLDAANATKNGKRALGENFPPAPKSEASEVIAPPASVALAKDDDDERAPNVMTTASKIVKLLERHRSPGEQARVMMCVVAGAGIGGFGLDAVTKPTTGA